MQLYGHTPWSSLAQQLGCASMAPLILVGWPHPLQLIGPWPGHTFLAPLRGWCGLFPQWVGWTGGGILGVPMAWWGMEGLWDPPAPCWDLSLLGSPVGVQAWGHYGPAELWSWTSLSPRDTGVPRGADGAGGLAMAAETWANPLIFQLVLFVRADPSSLSPYQTCGCRAPFPRKFIYLGSATGFWFK